MSEGDAERALWVKVIFQHMEDATSMSPFYAGDTPNLRHLVRLKARTWLLMPNDGFREVCDLAGLDHQAVREVAREQIAAFERDNADALRERATAISEDQPPKPKRAIRTGGGSAILTNKHKTGGFPSVHDCL
ncbi:hypothetical protein [Aurantimonas sp. 22II-16-19i]|uniref:hypothetical protein n=1 Tax=Aurantimonas sp. 22II-16-19i TaxID=1317114 RepID=UPI0009FA1BA2|nr:hypothetical protein [Aurantimonas sp. 22II-16-19i]